MEEVKDHMAKLGVSREKARDQEWTIRELNKSQCKADSDAKKIYNTQMELKKEIAKLNKGLEKAHFDIVDRGTKIVSLLTKAESDAKKYIIFKWSRRRISPPAWERVCPSHLHETFSTPQSLECLW